MITTTWKRRLAFCLLAWIVFTVPLAQAESFVSTSSVEKTRHMIRALPADDVWWTANGKQMQWNNLNLMRFLPTVPVYRAGKVRALAYNINPAIARFPVEIDGKTLTFGDYLRSSDVTTMAVVILKDGKIVFEDYPRQAAYEKPIFWSVTKVFVAGVIAILAEEGRIDVDEPVQRYLPTMKGSAFAGVTVRNLLDMATGLDCREDYEDKASCYYQVAASVGDGHFTRESPDNPYELLPRLAVARYAEQGTSFAYSSVNTFILGWIVEEVMGMPFQDALSKLIWTKMGAEHDAMILAPRYGVPLTWGGLMATPRDVARFGLLHTPSWSVVADQRIFSEAYINLLKDGGNPALLANARWGAPGEDVDHNVYQWDLVFDNNDLYKGGWAGQGLLVNPDKDLVVVYTGFMNEAGASTPLLPVLRRMLNSLYPGISAAP